jgi:hypothetical protein
LAFHAIDGLRDFLYPAGERIRLICDLLHEGFQESVVAIDGCLQLLYQLLHIDHVFLELEHFFALRISGTGRQGDQ